jgi:hypothetical protein
MGDKVLVAVLLDDEEARRLEEVAKRKGVGLGDVLVEALRRLLYEDSASTSLRALYLSRQGVRIQGTASP